MQVHIRQATQDDAADICRIVRASIAACCRLDHHDDAERLARWLANKTLANIASWIAQNGAIALLALSADKAVGTTLLSSNTLSLCYVLPEALHQGIGSRLLVQTEAAALAQGISRLQLDSTKTAIPFYLRHGFAMAGPPRSWAGLEAQPMSKVLGHRPPRQHAASI